jgi:hypothetical protein
MHGGAHMTRLAQRLGHRLGMVALVVHDQHLRPNL